VSPPLDVSPERLVHDAVSRHAKIVVSTYNEPLITSEWAVEIFKIAKQQGLLCGYVSNGNARETRIHSPMFEADRPQVDSDKNYRTLGAPLDHILGGIKMVQSSILARSLRLSQALTARPGNSWMRRNSFAPFSDPWHVTASTKITNDRPRRYRRQDTDSGSEIGQEAGITSMLAPQARRNVEHLLPRANSLIAVGYSSPIIKSPPKVLAPNAQKSRHLVSHPCPPGSAGPKICR
jgi:pyruvate formate lyase activating enzyme